MNTRTDVEFVFEHLCRVVHFCVVIGQGHVRYDANVRSSHSSAVQPCSIAVLRPSMGSFVVDGGCVLRCSGSYCISDVLTVDSLCVRSGFARCLITHWL